VSPGYRGRFAPSPTGALHAGSLVAALASWLDARAHHGVWLVRIEDVDRTRCLPGIDQLILQQLAACGLASDEPVVYQSQRAALYQQALDTLVAGALAYPCGCSRKDVENTLRRSGQHKPRHGELIYPGTCRAGLHGSLARGWRLQTDFYIENQAIALIDKALQATNNKAYFDFDRNALNTGATTGMRTTTVLQWTDRRLGPQQQDVVAEVGDFILKRADGCFAYQLAVVVDDGAQNISDVVRGADLSDNTARQILLQRALGLPTPSYLHTPLVLGPNGEKLSKQNGAQALDLSDPLRALNAAATVLGLTADAGPIGPALQRWTAQWTTRWRTDTGATNPQKSGYQLAKG